MKAMKSKWRSISLTIILVAAFLLAVGLYSSTEWVIEKEIVSPDKKLKIYITYSGSEAGPAPYGTYLFVAPWWQPFPYHFKEPFAAGYFENNLNAKWKTNKKIEISGSAEKIVIKNEKVGPVTISYAIK